MNGVAGSCSKTVQESDIVGALVAPWPGVAAGHFDRNYYLLNMPNLPEDLKRMKFQRFHDGASFYRKDNLTGNLRELPNCSRNWSRLSL